MSASGRMRDPIGKRTIVVDGKEYADVEAMPPEVRRVYEETIGSLGTPGAKQTGSSHVVRTENGLIVRSDDTRITVGGETFDLAEVPPELREVLERHLAGAVPQPQTGGDQPWKETRTHTVRIVHETHSGGSPLRRRRGRHSGWVTLLILAVCAGILALIVLAS